LFTLKTQPTQISLRSQLIESLRKRYLDGTLDEILFHETVNVDRLCAALVQENATGSSEQTALERPALVAHEPEFLR
jgi:hypothetical protein